MHVIIENWGPIERFDFDLTKSIIITYGENNIGKSYAMQALYLLLKELIRYVRDLFSYQLYYYGKELPEPRTELEKVVMGFAQGEESSRDITDVLKAIYAERMTAAIMPDFLDACDNTFGTFQTILDGEPRITLVLDEKNQYVFSMSEHKIDVFVEQKQVILKKTSSDFHKSRDNKTHLDIYVYGNHVRDPLHKAEEVLSQMRADFAINIQKKVENVYFLPASRSGIYNGMSSFGPILAELSKSRAYIKNTFQIPSLSEPISDYFMALANIKGESTGPFKEYAEMIERSILKGNVLFDIKNKSLMYQPYDEEINLEMTDTSSMVSEISPITAYIKYIIQRNTRIPGIRRGREGNSESKSILFIEEPEAHLHPVNQVLLMEIFVQLSKQNVQLVMASHSNYIFNKLNNMILSKELDKESYAPTLLKKENGKSNSYHMYCDEFGANDENFADIANQLYEEREAIIQQMLYKGEEE